MTLLDLPGVDLPIIQAPMAGVQDSALAIAVGRAGALGSLPCALLTPEKLQAELATLQASTDRAINLNFFCHTPEPPDSLRESSWRAELAPYYREYSVDPDTAPAGPVRAPFSEEALEVISAFAPRVVSFHFGLPASHMLDRMKAWGAKILSSATTVDEARWLEAHGADAIIAQGVEAGGHRGMFLTEDIDTQLGLFALLPQIVDAVHIPVIAAGGIADARGVAAARALGAAAVQVGTAYLLCAEARTSVVHRTALKSNAVSRTALTNLFTGRPARGIVNRLMRELGPMNPAVPAFPRGASATAALRACAEGLGRDDFTPLWCGQNASGCREIPASEITRDLAAGL